MFGRQPEYTGLRKLVWVSAHGVAYAAVSNQFSYLEASKNIIRTDTCFVIGPAQRIFFVVDKKEKQDN